MTQLRVPLYMDSAGIAALYAQTVDRLEEEVLKISGTQREKKFLARTGFGGLLLKLIGGVEVEGGIANIREQAEHAKLTMSDEHKLNSLAAFLIESKDNSFQRNTVDAILSCQAEHSPFVHLTQDFIATQFRVGEGEVAAVNEGGSLLFDATVQGDDGQSEVEIVMAAGLANCLLARGGRIGMMSHLAILLRERRTEPIALEVFGYMFRLTDRRFQIKPYAIWFASAPFRL